MMRERDRTSQLEANPLVGRVHEGSFSTSLVDQLRNACRTRQCQGRRGVSMTVTAPEGAVGRNDEMTTHCRNIAFRTLYS